jgi:hypothetical protein
VLLAVPKYDENWQFGYLLAEPLKVPAGSKMVVVAHYDNSQSNKTVNAPAELAATCSCRSCNTRLMLAAR